MPIGLNYDPFRDTCVGSQSPRHVQSQLDCGSDTWTLDGAVMNMHFPVCLRDAVGRSLIIITKVRSQSTGRLYNVQPVHLTEWM